MKQYLDAEGLNRYHTSLKDDMSASYNDLKDYVDSSLGQFSKRVEDGFDSVDSSINNLEQGIMEKLTEMLSWY